MVPVTDGHIRRRGLGDADAGSIPASGDELERGGETLSLIGVVADELQESGVAGREDDGKSGGNTAVAGGATERSEDNGVTGCTVTHSDDVIFCNAPGGSKWVIFIYLCDNRTFKNNKAIKNKSAPKLQNNKAEKANV